MIYVITVLPEIQYCKLDQITNSIFPEDMEFYLKIMLIMMIYAVHVEAGKQEGGASMDNNAP